MIHAAVTEARVPEGIPAHEKLLKKVLEYVIVAGGLDKALTDEAAREEVSDNTEHPISQLLLL